MILSPGKRNTDEGTRNDATISAELVQPGKLFKKEVLFFFAKLHFRNLLEWMLEKTAEAHLKWEVQVDFIW